MQIERNDLNPCTVELKVVCELEEVKSGYKKAYKYFSKRVRVPGFRPGTAPKAMIENMIDAEDLKNQASEEIVKGLYKKILDQENLKPMDYPKVSIENIDEEGCDFSLKVPLEPIVEIADYKKMKIEQPPVEVTDEDCQSVIEELRQRHGKREQVTDRGAQEGDTALVNIKLEGSDESRRFMVLVGKTFEQLDKELLGMKKEDSKKLKLDFPETFHEKDWANTTQSCEVTVASLSAMNLPEVNDEFVQSLREDDHYEKVLLSKDLKEFNEKVKERVKEAKEGMAKSQLSEQLLEDLYNQSTIHIPDNLWEDTAHQRLADLYQEARKQDLSFEEFAEKQGVSVEQLENDIKEDSKERICRAVLADKIVELENLQLTEEYLNDALYRMAIELNAEVGVLFEHLKKHNRLNELRYRAIFRKAMDFLVENAEIIEKVPEKATSK